LRKKIKQARPIQSIRPGYPPKSRKKIVVKTVALIQDLPWSIAGAGWTMAATKVAVERSAPDQTATVFMARKEIMKNENLSKQIALAVRFKAAFVQAKNHKSNSIPDRQLPSSSGGEGRMRAFSLSSSDIHESPVYRPLLSIIGFQKLSVRQAEKKLRKS
jgi:hypothetical protein